jgi:hypothetical protein
LGAGDALTSAVAGAGADSAALAALAATLAAFLILLTRGLAILYPPKIDKLSIVNSVENSLF